MQRIVNTEGIMRRGILNLHVCRQDFKLTANTSV